MPILVSGALQSPCFPNARTRLKPSRNKFGSYGVWLFHPRAEAPTDPNAGLVRYDPGSHHPFHKHDFAQVWYILEGTFTIGEATYGPRHDALLPRPAFRAAAHHRDRRAHALRPVPGADDRGAPRLRRPVQHDRATADRRGKRRALIRSVAVK